MAFFKLVPPECDVVPGGADGPVGAARRGGVSTPHLAE